jgi:AcrR family transcriptional regulator
MRRAAKPLSARPPRARQASGVTKGDGAAIDFSVSQEEVLRAASLVFMEKGFGSATIDEIAERLGATKGRVYHYYRSKTDLFLALQIWGVEHFLTNIRPISLDLSLAPPDRLYNMVLRHVIMILTGYGFESTGLARENSLLGITTTAQHQTRRRLIELRDQYEDLFASVVEEGIASGPFEKVRPRLATKPMMGALTSPLQWFKPGAQNASSIEEIAAYHATFVTRAVAKAPVS